MLYGKTMEETQENRRKFEEQRQQIEKKESKRAVKGLEIVFFIGAVITLFLVFAAELVRAENLLQRWAREDGERELQQYRENTTHIIRSVPVGMTEKDLQEQAADTCKITGMDTHVELGSFCSYGTCMQREIRYYCSPLSRGR